MMQGCLNARDRMKVEDDLPYICAFIELIPRMTSIPGAEPSGLLGQHAFDLQGY
jgi:hypothetical protein